MNAPGGTVSVWWPPPCSVPVATVASGSWMLAASAWLRSTVIHGCGVNTPSVSRVSRVRSGSSTVAASFQVPPAGTTSGGATTASPGVPLRAVIGVAAAGQART
jgi:hypothetical protein